MADERKRRERAMDPARAQDAVDPEETRLASTRCSGSGERRGTEASVRWRNPNSLQRHSSSSTHSLLPISFELVVPLNASSLIPSLPFSCRISPTASQVGPSKLTPSLLLVQLTILQWKHSSRARLLPPSRCSVPPSPAPSLFHRMHLILQ
ncbi:hypothetical protein HN51_047131 [Arachis hypogaea]